MGFSIYSYVAICEVGQDAEGAPDGDVNRGQVLVEDGAGFRNLNMKTVPVGRILMTLPAPLYAISLKEEIVPPIFFRMV